MSFHHHPRKQVQDLSSAPIHTVCGRLLYTGGGAEIVFIYVYIGLTIIHVHTSSKLRKGSFTHIITVCLSIRLSPHVVLKTVL